MKAGAGWMTRENGKRLISNSYPQGATRASEILPFGPPRFT